ncbi:MAG: hypothetical protein J2P17_06945, partial [Mycobacterium sp.]|nr:hypothetical protein [Mycobacterium sp.]
DQKMSNDDGVRQQITLLKGSANLIQGNLLSLPVGGGMMYVEPLYLQSQGQNSYLQMKYVLLNFGQYVGFDTTLAGAVAKLVNSAKAGNPTNAPPGTTNPPNAPPSQSPSASPSGPPNTSNESVTAAVNQLNKALGDVKAAQQSGDLGQLGQALQELQQAIDAYNRAVQAANAPAPGGSSTPSVAPSSPG